MGAGSHERAVVQSAADFVADVTDEGGFSGGGREARGREGLARAIAFHDRHQGAHGDLVRACFAPAQVDTCTPELLRAAKQAADERGCPITLHTSQSVVEFNEMLARHGKTPIAWMRELGVLGPNTILGHAIIVGGSSWTNYPAGDVRIMADSGCSVAHAVWVFARRGVAMESFAKYRAAGINMTLGTDTNPQSVIEAMRWAAAVSKMMERETESTTAAHVFDAATGTPLHSWQRVDWINPGHLQILPAGRLFADCAAVGTLLLTYHGQEGLQLNRKVKR